MASTALATSACITSLMRCNATHQSTTAVFEESLRNTPRDRRFAQTIQQKERTRIVYTELVEKAWRDWSRSGPDRTQS